MKLLSTIGLTMCMMSFSVSAQNTSDWDWKITPYLWAANLGGNLSIGPIEQDIDASFSDIFSNLEVGGSIFAEFGKGHHTVHFDYTYLRLRPEPTQLAFPPNSELETKMTAKYFESAYNFRWNGSGDGPALVLGARYTDLSIRMNPGRLSAVSSGPSWWDYFVGIKTHNAISNKWDFDFYGTVGTGGSDLPWTLQAMFGRRYSNDNRLVLGIRAWNSDYSETKGLVTTNLDLNYYGLMVGYEFN